MTGSCSPVEGIGRVSKGAGGAAASSGDRASPPEAAIMDASRWRRDGEVGGMQSAPCLDG